MNRQFGPWATSLGCGRRAQLSTFWKRRLALLPAAGSNAPRSSARIVAGLGMLLVVAVMLPRVASQAQQNEPPASSASAPASGPTNPPASAPTSGPTRPAASAPTSGPTAEVLMQQLYDNEAWPARVEGLLLRTETVQQRTAAGMQPGPTIPGPFAPSNKPPEKTLTIKRLIAWDPQRVTTVSELVGFSIDRRTFSEGQAVSESTRLENGQPTSQSFVLDNKTDLIFQHTFAHNLQWGHLGRHMGPLTWWRKPYSHRQGGQEYHEPAEIRPPLGLRLVGREQYNGHDCYRVDWTTGNDRFYIRANDRRLLGDLRFGYRVQPADDLRIKSQIAGRNLETENDWPAWLESQPPAARIAAAGRYDAERQQRLLLYAERTYDDYRELAPGCWFPFQQRYRSYRTDSGKSQLTVEGNIRVVEAVVNPTLPDELFAHEIPAGADISTDWRYDPPIRYTYRADQTEEERQQLAAKGRADLDEGRKLLDDIKAGVDERLGQALPPLPREGWLNTEPLSWQDLRGKAVQIVFWDIGCGPCHFTLDLVQQAAADAKLRGQAFLAIHRATKDRAAVEKALAQHKWTMPVLIDSDGKDPSEPSLYDWLHIKAMPWVVLVNQQGHIVAHDNGTFGSEIFAKFGQLWRTGEIKGE